MNEDERGKANTSGRQLQAVETGAWGVPEWQSLAMAMHSKTRNRTVSYKIKKNF